MIDDNALAVVDADADEDVQPDVEQAIAQLPKELQATCRKLKQMIGQYRGQNLENVYRLGEVVRDGLAKLAKKHGGQEDGSYGTGAVKQWEAALNIPARTLYTAMALVQTYAWDDLEKLLKTDCFTTSHFIRLLSVGNPIRRQEFERRVIAERWSTNRLTQEIRAVLGNQRPGSGRRPKAARSFREAFARVQQGLQRFKLLFEGTLFAADFDLGNVILDTASNEWSAKKLEEIRQAADMFDELSVTARRNAGTLRDAAGVVEDMLSKQQNLATTADGDAAPVADEEPDEDDDEDAAA